MTRAALTAPPAPTASRARAALALAALALAALLGAGCASTHDVARDLTITNQPDVFEMHIGSLENFTQRLSYRWTNTGTKATVRQASSVAEGAAEIVIRDDSGHEVHTKSLREVGSYVTQEGKPGVWRIQVTLSRATGSVTFLVRKSA